MSRDICFYKQMLIYLSIHLFGYCWFLGVRPPKGASSCLTAESCIQFDSSFWLAVLSGFVYDRRKHPHERTQTKQGHCWHEKNLRVANTESFGCRGCSSNMKRLLASHSSLVGENSAHCGYSAVLSNSFRAVRKLSVKLGHSLHILKGCSKCCIAAPSRNLDSGPWPPHRKFHKVVYKCVQ
jgi:hypothetical protein